MSATKEPAWRVLPLDVTFTAVLTVAWFALWLLWPWSQAQSVPEEEPVEPGTTFSFSRAVPGIDPGRQATMMVLPSPAGFSGFVVEQALSHEALTAMRPNTSRVLELSEWNAGGAGDSLGDGPGRWFIKPIGRYEPVSSETPLFNFKAQSPVTNVTLAMSSTLTACGLEVAVDSARSVLRSKAAWIVGAQVEVDQRGSVTHVFIDKPADVAGVNQAVLRALYSAVAKRPGRACAGNVTLSWPGN